MPILMASMAGPSFSTEAQANSLSTTQLSENQVSKSAALSTPSSPAGKQPEKHRGFGVFGRGFFARPVDHPIEESYRYLMALDP